MKVLAVGGGSGGHVTPVVAVLRELELNSRPDEIRFWVDRKFALQAKSIMAAFNPALRVDIIASGKLRRYHHLPIWRQLLMPSIFWPNLIDLFKVAFGAVQSLIKLLIWRPDVIFSKGGFVCLPVGWAAHVLKIPLVIHDSDAHPGLTNRILAKWANSIATGAPVKYYPYPKRKTHYVGIPIDSSFQAVDQTQKQRYKQDWKVDLKRPLIVITGGGLGAKRLNDVAASQLEQLTKLGSVILVSGKNQYQELRDRLGDDSTTFKLLDFTTKMPALLKAADVVVARAGATSILELAALGLPTILVPNGQLTGGHQLKNAEVYAKNKAVEVLNESDLEQNPQLLTQRINWLLSNKEYSQQMAQRFLTFAKPEAARQAAQLISRAAKETS